MLKESIDDGDNSCVKRMLLPTLLTSINTTSFGIVALLMVLVIVISSTILMKLDYYIKVYDDARYQLIYKDSYDINYDSLTWISKNEGISSHYFQLQTMYTLSQYYNMTLRLPDYRSNHYGKDVLIRMCDIFVLPSGIICFNEPPDMIIRSLKCTIPIEHFNDTQLNPSQTLPSFLHRYHIKNYNAKYLNIKEKFSWNERTLVNGYNTKCALANAFEFKLKSPASDDDFPITMTQKYIDMFRVVINNLFEDGRDGYVFIAVHWRRGDQLQSRCETFSDNSVNCENSKALIQAINIAISQKMNDSSTDIFTGKNVITYIATNEMDSVELMNLSDEGYFLKSDVLFVNDHLIENEVDTFIMDFLLMAESDIYFYWGSSGVHDLVLRYKRQNFKHRRLVIQDLTALERFHS